MSEPDRGLEAIVGIAVFSYIASQVFGFVRGVKPGEAAEPLEEWKVKSEEAYPVGGPGPGGVGTIVEPGIVSYDGVTLPVQPPGWHEEVIEEKIAAREEAIAEGRITVTGIEPPPVPETVGISPYTPGYQQVFEEAYRPHIEALKEYRREVREAIGLREYVPPPMPRESRGRR